MYLSPEDYLGMIDRVNTLVAQNHAYSRDIQSLGGNYYGKRNSQQLTQSNYPFPKSHKQNFDPFSSLQSGLQGQDRKSLAVVSKNLEGQIKMTIEEQMGYLREEIKKLKVHDSQALAKKPTEPQLQQINTQQNEIGKQVRFLYQIWNNGQTNPSPIQLFTWINNKMVESQVTKAIKNYKQPQARISMLTGEKETEYPEKISQRKKEKAPEKTKSSRIKQSSSNRSTEKREASASDRQSEQVQKYEKSDRTEISPSPKRPKQAKQPKKNNTSKKKQKPQKNQSPKINIKPPKPPKSPALKKVSILKKNNVQGKSKTEDKKQKKLSTSKPLKQEQKIMQPKKGNSQKIVSVKKMGSEKKTSIVKVESQRKFQKPSMSKKAVGSERKVIPKMTQSKILSKSVIGSKSNLKVSHLKKPSSKQIKQSSTTSLRLMGNSTVDKPKKSSAFLNVMPVSQRKGSTSKMSKTSKPNIKKTNSQMKISTSKLSTTSKKNVNGMTVSKRKVSTSQMSKTGEPKSKGKKKEAITQQL